MSAIRLLCIWCQIEFQVGHWTTALDQGAKHTSDNAFGGPCLCRLGYIEVLKGGLKKPSHRNFLGRGNTSLIHRTDVDDDTCFFLAFEGFISCDFHDDYEILSEMVLVERTVGW